MNQINIERNEMIAAQLSQFDDLRTRFLEGLEITDKNADLASDCLKSIKVYIKTIESERKKITVPIDEAKRAVMDQVKRVLEPLKYEEEILRSNLTAYQVEKRRLEEERLRMEKKAEEERLKKIRDGQMEQAEMGSELALEDAVATQEELEKVEKMKIRGEGKVRGEMSSSHLVERWVFEVDDIRKVPRKYLILNEKLVRNIITGKDGLHEIPGLKIFKKTSLATK